MSARASDHETALVTGASRGIGYELAKRFAADGFDLVLVARSEDRLQEVGAELEADHGVDSTVVPADLADPEGARSVYEAVSADGHVVEALVNNAGFGVYGEFVETDLEQELDVIELHVVAVTVLTKLFAREMADRGHGYVLNNASTAGFAPLPTSTVYSAAKHYERSFSEALAEELADAGVTVTALCPGETDTGFMERGNYEEAAYEPGDLMDPATVAEAGYRGLMNGERVVVPGWKNKVRIFLRRLLPRRAYVRAAERAQNE
ncbi:MAG: SDR family NAD(P)-dependent oxidoreductase [Halobacteriales archaeon]